MENQFDTDEQLRNALRDFEAIPDRDSFDAILEKMNRQKKRRLFIIFFWTGLIALSAIAVPLLFNFYDTATPVTGSMAKTQAVSPEKTADGIHDPQTATHSYIQREASSSSRTASSSETSKPEAGTDREGFTNTTSGASAVSISFSRTKQLQEKKTFEQADKADPNAAGKHELHLKSNAGSGSAKENSITYPASPESLAGTTSSESLAFPATASEVMYMPVIQIPWLADSTRREITGSLKESSYAALGKTSKNKIPVSFYLGAQASPQGNDFIFSKNPGGNHAYHTIEVDFPDFYLNTKKDQRNFNFNLPFGLKAGVQINNTYEVLAGFGIQTFNEKEKLYAVSPTTVTPTSISGIAYNTGPDYSMPNKNRFRYLYYSLEANRLFQTRRAIGFKLGLGLYGNQAINSSYVFVISPNAYGSAQTGKEKLSPWLFVTKVKAGVIFNANRRFQLHISPGFFYCPASIFTKDYVIRQKPYGVDVECLLLFRLFKISGK